MKANPYPGFEELMLAYRKEETKEIAEAKRKLAICQKTFAIPDQMRIEERQIPGENGEPEIKIRIFTPALPEKTIPIIMDIHGGGWANGSMDTDTYRCIEIAKKVPAIVVTVEYRLANGQDIAFPIPMLDCYRVFCWLYEHSEELGGTKGLIGLHGNSAGANLAEAISLYARDHNGPTPMLTALICPPLSLDFTKDISYHQWYDYKIGKASPKLFAEPRYLGGYNGEMASYYAFPQNCQDLAGLPPHLVVVAEYDALRDDGLSYAWKLLKHGVSCEIFCAARVGHCYNSMPHTYSDLTHDIIARAFQREFGMLDTDSRGNAK